MGCNCGNNKAKVQYLVTLKSGGTKTVGTIAEARIAVATGGGGTYKAVPVK